MPSWPSSRGKVVAFRRREGVTCWSRSPKLEILAKALSTWNADNEGNTSWIRRVKKSRMRTCSFTLSIAWGGAGAYVEVEDVFMEMWKLAPARFRWRKYEVPNYKIMSQAIADISRRGHRHLLLGSQNTRQLSAEGVAWVQQRKDRFEALAAGELSAPPARRPGQRAVAELLKKTLVRKFLDGVKPELDRAGIARLLRCAPDAPRRVWKERLETLRSAARDGNRDDVLAFLGYLEEEKSEWFDSE